MLICVFPLNLTSIINTFTDEPVFLTELTYVLFALLGVFTSIAYGCNDHIKKAIFLNKNDDKKTDIYDNDIKDNIEKINLNDVS